MTKVRAMAWVMTKVRAMAWEMTKVRAGLAIWSGVWPG